MVVVLGDGTGVGASVDVNIVVAALVCYADTTTYDNGMVRMQYYDLPILRLIIGAEMDKVLRVCKSLVPLSDILRPHSVGFAPLIAYSVFMSSLAAWVLQLTIMLEVQSCTLTSIL